MAALAHNDSTRLPKPRVSRHGRRLHLSYEFSQRLNTSQVYPVQSPRGAEIVISGYDDGLYIVWRGGPLLSEHRQTVADPDAHHSDHDRGSRDALSITKMSGKSRKLLVTEDVLAEDKPHYEPDAGEMDEDDPYPAIVQDLKLCLGSPVLRLAIPSLSSSPGWHTTAQIPLIVQMRIVVVALCADGSVRLITLPLTPPTTSTQKKNRLGAQICTIFPPTPFKSTPHDVALTWTPKSVMRPLDEADDVDMDASNQASGATEDDDLDLLVAVSTSGISEQVHFVRVPVTFEKWTGGKIPAHVQAFRTLSLAAAAKRISFNTSTYPSRKHSQLLIADAKGSLKVYDPLASDPGRSRPSSRDSGSESVSDLGAWVIAFDTGFRMSKDTASNLPSLAQRRKFLDARWICGGRSILVLLDDGEWGVWDVDGGRPKSDQSSATSNMADFAIRGFIGDTSGSDAPISSDVKSRAAPRLAPMTPNTRRNRQESLFSGPTSRASGAAPKGGLSAAMTAGSHGTFDDSVVLWYGGEAYHIPSLQSLWQRSVSSSGRDIGSLYGPGLSRIEGLDLSGEVLNSIEQFPAKATAVSVGNIVQRDFLVVGEHRVIITIPTKPQTPTKSMFARDNGSSVTKAFDQQLLDRGELDIGGVDRLLDSMTGTERMNGIGKGKRVGFVR
ncbi:hypothetical protein MBLNU459_g0012t1 [Dothideomycetes sp. NU459]